MRRSMWPEKQRYPTADEARAILDRNPEEAAIRGKWSDPEFLKDVSDAQPEAQGHAVRRLSRPRLELSRGLQARPQGHAARQGRQGRCPTTTRRSSRRRCTSRHPPRQRHAVRRLPLRAGCPRQRPPLRRGRAAIEIDCADCHGTVDALPEPAAPPAPRRRRAARDLSLLAHAGRRKRFEWRERQALPALDARPPTANGKYAGQGLGHSRNHPKYNAKAARAKTDVERRLDEVGTRRRSGDNHAHANDKMTCYTLPPVVDDELRRLPPADPGELEDRAPPLRGRRDAQLRDLQPASRARRHVPARAARPGEGSRSRRCARARRSCCPRPTSTASGSTCSSRPSPRRASARRHSRRTIPHTVRKTETKTCTDCHVSQANDNNAIMAQLLLLGTNFVNFVGLQRVGRRGEAASKRCR